MFYQIQLSKPYILRVEVSPNNFAPHKFRDVSIPSIDFTTRLDVESKTMTQLKAELKKQLKAFLQAQEKEIVEIEI